MVLGINTKIKDNMINITYHNDRYFLPCAHFSGDTLNTKVVGACDLRVEVIASVQPLVRAHEVQLRHLYVIPYCSGTRHKI